MNGLNCAVGNHRSCDGSDHHGYKCWCDCHVPDSSNPFAARAHEDRVASHNVKQMSNAIEGLVRLREKYGMSQHDIAEAMGLETADIDDFECMGTSPTFTFVLAYAAAVNAKIDIATTPC